MSALTPESFERAALRVLKAARMTFDVDGSMNVPQTSSGIMRAALVCASSDFNLFNQAAASMQEPVEDADAVRAQHRIALALELADFFDLFGENADEETAVTP
jgi:hypothetical protein